MKELLLMAATIMPEEKVLEDVQEAIINYQVEKNEETKNRLVMHLHIAVLRMMTDGSTDKMAKILDEMKDFDRTKELFNKRQN